MKKINKYKSSKISQDMEKLNPYSIISELLQGLNEHLSDSIKSMDKGNLDSAKELAQKAEKIAFSLQKCLDFKEGGEIADNLNIPVLTFGIRTDFRGELFEGSKFLLAWADNIKEIKTICWCGRKATMIVRVSKDGKIITKGDQIMIGGNESYVSLCRKHFFLKQLK